MIRATVTLSATLMAFLLTTAWLPPVAHAGNIVAGPVYHAPSGSYFALAYELAGKDGLNWGKAKQRAETMSYKSRHGRLAIIDDISKHNLIRNNFKHRHDAWLGLRYWCQPRMLAWVNMSPHGNGAFQAWMPKWHRTHVRCGVNSIRYMGVYYTKDAQLWQAAGQSKHFPFFFVEFPADKAQ